MKLALAISIHPTSNPDVAFAGDLEATLARLAGMGYDGVELAIRDPRQVNGDELRALLRRYGLAAPMLATGQAWGEDHLSFTDADPIIRQAAIERIKSHIELAGQLDAMVMLGLIRGLLARAPSREQAMRWLLDAYRECADFALRRGVRLVIEPINRFQADAIFSARDGVELLAQIGRENVGLALDSFHMNIEDASIEDGIRLAGDRLFHFHVSDSNRWHPGAGHIDFRSIIAVLRAIGYTAYLSGEFKPLPDGETAARGCIERLRPLLSQDFTPTPTP
jgi:sugar phosphate isomerase/epimerase